MTDSETGYLLSVAGRAFVVLVIYLADGMVHLAALSFLNMIVF